jgi:hypothetical protein
LYGPLQEAPTCDTTIASIPTTQQINQTQDNRAQQNIPAPVNPFSYEQFKRYLLELYEITQEVTVEPYDYYINEKLIALRMVHDVETDDPLQTALQDNSISQDVKKWINENVANISQTRTLKFSEGGKEIKFAGFIKKAQTNNSSGQLIPLATTRNDLENGIISRHISVNDIAKNSYTMA